MRTALAYDRVARRRIWQDEVNQYKLEIGCQWPGCTSEITIAEQLEYAHLDQGSKEIKISRLLEYSPHKQENRDRLAAELAKCQILCCLHHRLETVLGKHAAYRRH